jgi:hypothetical protein
LVALVIAASEPETPTSLYDSWHTIAGASGATAVGQWIVVRKFRRKRNDLRRTLFDEESGS